MIERKRVGISEVESMVVSDGFVIAECSKTFGLEDSPFERSLSMPLFLAFKVNEEYPLVLHNNGGSSIVYPKRDFDSIQGDENQPKRFLAEWSQDRKAHDLATLMLVPYDVKEDRVWKKIDYVPPCSSQEMPRGASLLYLEHGMMFPSGNQRVAHVMPSAIPNYLYNWLRGIHRIESYDDEKHEWVGEGTIEIPIDTARKLALKVNNLLEKRFDISLFLEGH